MLRTRLKEPNASIHFQPLKCGNLNNQVILAWFQPFRIRKTPLQPPVTMLTAILSAGVGCGVLTDPSNGQVSFTTTTFLSVVTYSCNTGYSLEGNRKRTCTATGQWSDQAPTCIRGSIALNHTCRIMLKFT